MSVRLAAIAALIAGVAVIAATDAAAQQLEKPFRVLADGKPIDVDGGHAAPCFADFDGDGLRDLVVGQFSKGRCRVYKNTGTKQAPLFGDFTFLEAGGKTATVMAG
jgi:hypothetical protein